VKWLAAQVLAMLIVGVLITIGDYSSAFRHRWRWA
jgi:hypothetical protein